MAARNLETLKSRYNHYKAPQGRGPGGGGPRGRHGPMATGKPKQTGAIVKRLMSYLRPYRMHLIFAILCVFLTTASSLIASYMLGPIIDNFIAMVQGGPFSPKALMGILAVLACVYLAGIVFTYLQGRLMASISQNTIATIRKDLFSKVEKLPLRYHDT